ncbi:MAG: AraC family transcriptional regulator [Alcaligenaceae bacterium]|nr:AraC family transcriptional regulator [Alcaligenaceae bacterium]
MVLLRNMRLDAVRHTLQTSPGANVTTIALDHGFGHLGRFSAYYRERFGELPRDTTTRQFLPCM